MASIDKAKELAAHTAVNEHFLPLLNKINSNGDGKLVLGIGSGSTIVFAVKRLCQLKEQGKISRDFVCIPTSFQARQLILENNLPLGDLEQYPSVECTMDGADEVDPQLNCIKGGGGCQTQEKIVAHFSRKLVIVADYRKDSHKLGSKWQKGVPVEVLPFAYRSVMEAMKGVGGVPRIRMAESKAGPCITDNGNMILDVDFGEIDDAAGLNVKLISIPGVVETGLFIKMAQVAYFGMEDGSVQVR